MPRDTNTDVTHYPPDLSALTSFRFFAAMFVVLFHLRIYLPIDIDKYTGLFSKGSLAVDFFFVLSGFILFHVYQKDLLADRFDGQQFVLKRFARVYPMHLLMLVFYVVLFVVATKAGLELNKPEKYDFSAIPANLLMVHAWGFTDKLTFNFPSWSVSAEWFAYLIFPLMAPVLVHQRAGVLLLFSVVAYIVIWVMVDQALDLRLTQLTFQYAFIHIFPEFLLGIALYMVAGKLKIPQQRIWPLFLCVLGLVLLFLHFKWSNFLVIPLFGMLILLGAELSRTSTGRSLKSKVLVYLGEISYSIYMVHAAVFTVVLNGMKLLFKQPVPDSLLWAILLLIPCLVILTASLTYRFIEVPCRLYLTRVGNRLLGSPSP